MSARVSLSIPRGWPTRRDPARGVVLAARAPGGVGEVSVVVRAVDVPGEDLTTWRSRALRELAEAADSFSLEDDDAYDLMGLPTRYHRFAHREGPTEMLSEQWCWWTDGVGVTLSCTVATEQYPLYCELFEDIAASVEIADEAA